MDFGELKGRMKEAGIAGAGGAGFPSYGKLSEGLGVLLVNGSECEPLLYTDYHLLKRELSTVLAGAEAIAESAGIPETLLCIKEHTAEKLGRREGERLGTRVRVKLLPDVYPVGDEVSLIYQATGRLVRPGELPKSAGVLVYNAETVYNVGAKLLHGENVTYKWLTVGGAVEEPFVVRVPIGTSVGELFARHSVTVPEDCAVLDGGPSMGKLIDAESAVVTKTTKGLLVLPSHIEAIRSKRTDAEMSVARAETACCQCTHCTDVCPRALLGYPIEPHKLVRTSPQAAEADPRLVLSASLCCGCGLCTDFACCQGISPKAVIDHYKTVLKKHGLRFSARTEPRVSAEREYRMIPADRWKRSLGVEKFDRTPRYIGEESYSRVELPLSQSIGAPAVPAVGEGEWVERGQLIANAAEGLSLPLHAPIAGNVRIKDRAIVIERKE